MFKRQMMLRAPEELKTPVALPEIKLVTPTRTRGERLDPTTFYPLPVISGEAAAGTPAEVCEAEVEDWVPSIYNSEWCPHPESTVCVRVRGDSMTPTIQDGGLVAIDMRQRLPQKLRDKIVALRHDGGVTIKRLVLTDRREWIGRPDNAASSELFVFSDEEIVDAIVGKVVWWWSKAN
ncbi:MAG: S24 family peptidase [Candidatus Lernaella stagnicola]|nr:S24 family peptidase [Candidatus Lernaella stagnicola]